MTLETIRALSAILRECGVIEYEGPIRVDYGQEHWADHHVRLKLAGTSSVDLGGGPSAPTDLGAPERCPCGHEADVEHNGKGLCLRGCPVSLCHPETTKERVS